MKNSVSEVFIYYPSYAFLESFMSFPLFGGAIPAGFPSPAEDFNEERLDIRAYLVKNPSATFFARVTGDSMKDIGISDGDLLVVDRSVKPSEGKPAVCFLNGEFTLKKVSVREGKLYLLPANKNFPVIEVGAEEQFAVWGIVTHVIKSF
jgi:DNA polymerase V